jgi:hypothetical protein
MKTFGEVDVWMQIFFILTLVEGERSASCPGGFTSEEITPVPIGGEAGWTPEPVWTT